MTGYGASFTVRGEVAAVAARLVVSLFIGSPFIEKSPHAVYNIRAGISYSKSESAKVQGAKGLRFALSACGFGLLLLDEVVPLTADAPCAQNAAHVALGVLHRPLGYSDFGGCFYDFLAGKLLSVCQ